MEQGVTFMGQSDSTGPTVFIIFGAGGDLTRRKLVPSLFSLFLARHLPEQFQMFGVDHGSFDDGKFRSLLKEGVEQFSRPGKAEAEAWDNFAQTLSYLEGDFTDPKMGEDLEKRLEDLDQKWGTKSTRIFYFATPPALVEPLARQLNDIGLCKDCGRDRLVVEKPFGHDLESARHLDGILTSLFEESQIYRIDHYLGKETVQNILAFRFGNALFEPIWDRRYIDHVQITVAETVGVGQRGGYYDQAGALRDMVQNHLLQLFCMIAMESPVSFDADEIRNKKVDVLRAVLPIRPEEVHRFAVRGQYGRSRHSGETAPAYREEEKVAADSLTETFAALKLCINNWRWEGVPFYLRTGKRLPAKITEISIIFRPAPHQPFPSSAVENWQPNRLVIRIQPEEGILMRIQAKQPGTRMILGPVDMKFLYQEAFSAASPSAYETLLLDVMRGDATLFMRADQVEAAWSVITPLLEAWEGVPPGDFPDYAPGTWGPETADILITQDGRNWLMPILRDE
jgi:glucose-6-phosphate 1-dehydrogenase